MGVQWSRITPSQWEELPAPTPPKKANQWDEAIQVVMDGEVISITVTDETVRGIRIGIARRASTLGCKLAFRHDPSKGILAVRLAPDSAATPTAEASPEEEEKKPRQKK